MELSEILAKCDHTLLAQTSTWAEIKAICDDGMKYKTASVCIPASFVKQAKEYVGEKLAICTVIGFPNGYNTTAVKCFETEEAVKNGADEIDMVINIGALKDKKYDYVRDDIAAVVAAAKDRCVKVIIEAGLLTDEETAIATRLSCEAGAHFVKTSTGVNTTGATVADVKIMKANVTDGVKIKAAGGIKTAEFANELIAAGAERIGTSSGIEITKA